MVDTRARRGRAPGPLPRGTCPVCGNEYALRANRTLGQHQRRTLQGYRVGRCHGVGQPPVSTPKTVENTVAGADITAGNTPEITISSATEDTEPQPRSTPVHDVTTETQLRALDEKITPLYEYLGQHHAADIMIGEGPIEMALRLLRQHDEQHRTALGGIVPELTCRFEYDRRAADGVTATCRTHGDQVTGTADEITDWEDQHTANRIGARHVPPSRAHSRAREAEPTVAAWERIPYVERRGRLWAGCAVEPVVLLAEVPEEDPVPDEVWNAVVDAVPITAVTEALAEPADAAWNVCGLVERGVRAALAAVDQAHRAELA